MKNFNVEEKLSTENNSLNAAYIAVVKNNPEENDPERKIWKRLVAYVENHKDVLFDKEGNWSEGFNYKESDMEELLNRYK